MDLYSEKSHDQHCIWSAKRFVDDLDAWEFGINSGYMVI